MTTQPTKLQRWLDLIAYLSGRRVPVTVEEVWTHVPAYASGLEGDETEKQSVRRMFERDKDELKEIGIPIDTVTYSINYGHEQVQGYRLASKDFHLPYLRLVAESKAGGSRRGAGAYAEGHWYAVGHCTVECGIRIFRLDRILAADVTEHEFDAPADFHPEEFSSNGRVYRADAERPLRVRYSPRIARWIRERASWTSADVEELEDGSVVLAHRLADPWWAVGQALQYGAEAEILEPADVRALVAQVARELSGAA